MIKYTLQVLFLLQFFVVFSQSDQITYPNFLGSELMDVMKNPDWKILCETRGYLNKNPVFDFALVLESKENQTYQSCKSCPVNKIKPRIILIVIDNKVTIQNNEFIARGDEGGMTPYIVPDLSIKDQKLTIFWQYTRDNTSYVFQYRKKHMELISAQKVGVHAVTGDYESHDFDFIKKMVKLEKGNISELETKKETISIKHIKQLKRLSEMKKMYNWEVLHNVLL